MDAPLKTIDEYIQNFPEEIQKRMTQIRKTISATAPQAIEKISWAMPTFVQDGNLIHFAGYKNHIGIYPGGEAIEHLADKLTGYKTSKGAIQLPNNKPIPLDLVERIVKFNLKRNAGTVTKKER